MTDSVDREPVHVGDTAIDALEVIWAAEVGERDYATFRRVLERLADDRAPLA